ncbi:J domain-containing protein [Polyangium aurulentum]|uniref:J domain-containing protein n=1 Tax=Polyangium aurulentum TaxID=2567896 RepID=UPI0010ADB9E9|nr:J domain-containing protein [Polyangium aurulentum]UQA59329.1 J domain-containing protein [Polyangium aurulentum]
MTLDEALAELGLDHSASTDEARRAYLRLLKTRKPEVDREGFMRLREAYERARAELSLYEALRKAQEEDAPRIPIATPGGLVWIEISQPPAPPPPAAEIAPDKPDAPVETQENTPAEASADPPVFPDKPRPDELPATTDDARAGTHLPWEAPPPEPAHEPAPATDEAPAREPSVEELYANGKIKTAAKRAARLHREAAKHGDGSALPSARTTIGILLSLHRKNELAAAAQLHDAFKCWLAASGISARILMGEIVVLWSIASDLAALPPHFPSPLRSAIARATLAGNLDSARYDCLEFRDEEPSRAATAAALLRGNAPSLASILAASLERPAQDAADLFSRKGGGERRDRGGGGGSGRAAWVILPILVAVLRFVEIFARSSPETSYTPSNTPAYDGRTKLRLPPPMPASDSVPRSIWDLVDASHAEPTSAPDASIGKTKKAAAEGTATRNSSHAKDKPPKPSAASAPDAGPCGGTSEP